MTTNRFFILILAIFLGTAGLVVWIGSPKQNQPSSTTSAESPDAESSGTESAAATTSESMVIEVPSTGTLDAQNSELVETAAQSTREPVDIETEVNPFTLDESVVATTSSATAIISDNQTRPIESNSATPTAPAVIVAVPSSFPVEDAAKYFIPRDQRRPGNLGGPPPLPSAATLQGGPPPGPGENPIQPPTAPEQ